MPTPTLRIWIDDQPCDVSTANPSAAVNAAATIAQSRGRMIVDITLDGVPLV